MTSLAGITLTDHTLWPDEFGDSPVQMTRRVTRGGRQILWGKAKQKGRPITLVSHYNTRATADALYPLSKQSGLEMTLILPDARTFQVAFDHTQQQAFLAVPRRQINIYSATELYTITLKLIEV